jgi:hypothetical protein
MVTTLGVERKIWGGNSRRHVCRRFVFLFLPLPLFSLYLSLSLYIYISLSIFLSACLPVRPSICLPIWFVWSGLIGEVSRSEDGLDGSVDRERQA